MTWRVVSLPRCSRGKAVSRNKGKVSCMAKDPYLGFGSQNKVSGGKAYPARRKPTKPATCTLVGADAKS